MRILLLVVVLMNVIGCATIKRNMSVERSIVTGVPYIDQDSVSNYKTRESSDSAVAHRQWSAYYARTNTTAPEWVTSPRVTKSAFQIFMAGSGASVNWASYNLRCSSWRMNKAVSDYSYGTHFYR